MGAKRSGTGGRGRLEDTSTADASTHTVRHGRVTRPTGHRVGMGMDMGLGYGWVGARAGRGLGDTLEMRRQSGTQLQNAGTISVIAPSGLKSDNSVNQCLLSLRASAEAFLVQALPFQHCLDQSVNAVWPEYGLSGSIVVA